MNKRKKNLSKELRAILMGSLFIMIVFTITFVIVNNLIDSNATSINVANESPTKPSPNSKEQEYKILSLGNLIVHDSQIKGAKVGDSYNFDKSFEYITDLLQSSNLSLGIVEGSFNGGTPSGYPNFNIPDSFLTSLKKSGLDLVNFSTNHTIDFGSKGFIRSLSKLKENSLVPIGVRENTNMPKYTISEIDGHKVGFFSYTFRTDAHNGNSINSLPIPSDISPLINSFNYNNIPKFNSEVKEIVSDLKKNGAEFIISSIHWGSEYETKANKSQKQIAKILNENDVDVILGGHPHVIQPYETLVNSKGKKTLTFYSQGNTLSNQCYEELKNALPEDGLIVELTLGVRNNKLYLKSYNVIPTWVYRESNDNGTLTHRIVPVNDAIKNKGKFNISDSSYERVLRSLKNTTTIVGEGNLGSQQFN